MATRPRQRQLDRKHVRLHTFEIESEAYRDLNPNARALLVEMRNLYDGRTNRIYMSVRQAADRLGVSPPTASKAINSLLDHGFIRLIDRGSFHVKSRRASVYALTNEPVDALGREPAPMDFMKWRFSTVQEDEADGAIDLHRPPARSRSNPRDRAKDLCREAETRPGSVQAPCTQLERLAHN